MSMPEIKDTCTGCMACVNACPAGAMEIMENEYGFLTPVVNADKCTGCGLCERICLINKPVRETYPCSAFSAYHKDPAVVKKSSSGGAFYALAQHVLEKGGIVYGCRYDVEKKVAELVNTDTYPLDDLLTSKYVESTVSATDLQNVKAQLEIGREVLYCSTPCHAAGLRAFLNKPYENLLLVDFACGGVAANVYLREHLVMLEKEYGSQVATFGFRDKHYGWGHYALTVTFENGQTYRKTAMEDPYFFCFLRSSMQRLSCHSGPVNENHAADRTLSDFWKCDHFPGHNNNHKGLSRRLTYTQKATNLITTIPTLNTTPLNLPEATYNLKPRTCPQEKLPEIRSHQTLALTHGVTYLRNALLTPEQRDYYTKRQHIMDNPTERAANPDIVGRGQLM